MWTSSGTAATGATSRSSTEAPMNKKLVAILTVVCVLMMPVVPAPVTHAAVADIPANVCAVLNQHGFFNGTTYDAIVESFASLMRNGMVNGYFRTTEGVVAARGVMRAARDVQGGILRR